MKYPKTLRLFGYNWKLEIVEDKSKENGGSFNWSERKIVVNNRYGELYMILLHEIIESIMVRNLVRYYGNEGNSEFKFMFNHTEFCKIVDDIFQALQDNNLIKKF